MGFLVCHVLSAALLPHSERRAEPAEACWEIPLCENGGVRLLLVCSKILCSQSHMLLVVLFQLFGLCFKVSLDVISGYVHFESSALYVSAAALLVWLACIF